MTNKNLKGQSLVEILVSLGIFALVVTATFFLVFGGQSISSDSSNAQIANEYAVEGAEAVFSIKERDWDELTVGDHGMVFLSDEWHFASDTTDTKDIFTRTVSIATTSDEDVKTATTTITWQTDPIRTQTLVTVTVLTNWLGVLEENEDTGGDTGGSNPLGDWMNPQTLGTDDVDAGGQATDLDVLNQVVYLSSSFADVKKPDFYIFDVSTPTAPVQTGSLDIGEGLNSLDVANTYLFGASQDTTAQLQIIDISNMSSPSFITALKLPGTGDVEAKAVYFYQDKVFMGTSVDGTGEEFHIIDVSDPAAPSGLGSVEMNVDVNMIHVKNGLAFIATGDDNAELRIFDVSNPASPTLVTNYDLAGTEDALSIFFVGDTVYLGRAEGANDELYIIDVTNPSSPQTLGSKDITASVNDIRSFGELAFFVTDDPGAEFQVWNIEDPANVIFWSSFNFPQVGTGIDYENNIVYVSVRSNDALRIITSTP